VKPAAKQKTLPTDPRGFANWLGKFLCRAHHVACLKALRAFEQIELDGLAFVQRAVAVLLDGRKMHEHVLARGALDESVSLRPIEPLHSTLFSHKETPFASSKNYSSVACRFALVMPDTRYRTLDTGAPPQRTVRVFCWRRRARAIPHQQKRLPCIPSNGCPRRNTAKPRKRRRDIRLLTQKRQPYLVARQPGPDDEQEIIAGRFQLARGKLLRTN